MKLVLVRGSRWLYGYMGSDGGAVPWGALFTMACLAGLGAGVGTLAAVALGTDASDRRFVGVMVALAIGMACLLGASFVVLVAWLLKIDDDDQRAARRSKR